MNAEDLKPAKGVDFKLNEPRKPVPGGPRRPSVRVDASGWPLIERRRELNRLLLAHDPETFQENIAQLRESDGAILRVMARESVAAGSEPALRMAAISALSRFPVPENLAALADLCRHGEDPYVRGQAMYALADTGLELALPLLRDGLAARDPVEVRKAQLGVRKLGATLGESRVRYVLRNERSATVRARLAVALENLGEKSRSKGARPQPKRTAEDG